MNPEEKDQQQPVEQAETQRPAPADDNDFPLGPACDLSGEGACEACQ